MFVCAPWLHSHSVSGLWHCSHCYSGHVYVLYFRTVRTPHLPSLHTQLRGCSISMWVRWTITIVASPVFQSWSHCCSMNICTLDPGSAATPEGPVPYASLEMLQWGDLSPRHWNHRCPKLWSHSPSMHVCALNPSRRWCHCHRECPHKLDQVPRDLSIQAQLPPQGQKENGRTLAVSTTENCNSPHCFCGQPQRWLQRTSAIFTTLTSADGGCMGTMLLYAP